MLLLTWSLVTLCAAEHENGTAAVARRVSAAEVETVRLEVEQTNFDKELQIRVRDYAALAGKKTRIACEIRSVGENGKEKKIGAVALKLASATSTDFCGTFQTGEEFTHEGIVRVIYRSEALKLPVSTWMTVFYQ